ncbi:hypothetical protein H0H92_000874 [Tricholoma furcatifolium]|nr:hypothetical protein H0H92_000874 [Tricholoma furcatifolium]
MDRLLLPLLACPVCNKTLVSPVSLHCGHSVCAAHANRHSCPHSDANPNISSSSAVAYYPATPLPPTHPTLSPFDVTLSKLVDLITAQQPLPKRRRRDSDDDDHSPRKRPRLDDDSNDLLSHLLATSARQREIPHDRPLLPPDPSPPDQAKFQKDLLSELTFLTAFPALYRERGEAIEAEERDARLDTPIFVCQLSFPGMPTLLHFFEPRYRLMLRRCLESPHPCFGMVMPPKPGAISPQFEYGTMLQIRSVQMQPDGRSLVETWATFRFRLLETGTLDGYMVGRIERIDDYPEDPIPPSLPITSVPHSAAPDTPHHRRSRSPSPPSDTEEPTTTTPPSSETTEDTPRPSDTVEPTPPTRIPILLPNHPTNDALMAQCRTFLDQLQRGTAPWIVQRLASTYGDMPTDPALFSYWVATILPIDEHEKAKLLPIRSPRLRLLLVVHWIEQLNNNWYSAFYFPAMAVIKGLLLIGFFVCFFVAPLVN